MERGCGISKVSINRILHGPMYTTPNFIGLFEAIHHEVKREEEIKDPTSRERIMCWIAGT